MQHNSATSITIVRTEIAVLALVSCVRDVPKPPPEASPDDVVRVAVAPQIPAIPAPDELSCTSDADCVAVPNGCCDALPSNALHIASVRKRVTTDAPRDCRQVKCESHPTHAACNQGRCVVW
jgi:hypothetical protein